MTLIKTSTGTTWDLDAPATSNLITHIGDNGRSVMSTLMILGSKGTHEEFMEQKTDLLVMDQFGETHEICEDFIWQ